MSVTQRATYDDLAALPNNVVGEILAGELHASPRPRSRHAVVSSYLGYQLGPAFGSGGGSSDQPGGWWILDEPELHFGDDVLVPDLAGWRRERMPVLEDVAAFTLAPDWIAEVLSPSTARVDRVQKMPIYAREGVAHAWLLDPLARTLEVFRLDNQRWLVAATFGGDDVVRPEPFEARDLELGRLWLPEPAAE